MIIRKAYEDDLNSICALSNEIYGDHFKSMPDNFLEPKDDNRDAAYWQCFMNVDDAIILVAQEKEKIIGAVCAKIVITKGIPFLAEKTRLYIGTIVVTDKHQRCGIASLLMSHVEEFSEKFNATEVLLEVMSFNQDAINFYRALGFDDFSTKLVKKLS